MTSKLKNDLKELHDDAPRKLDCETMGAYAKGRNPNLSGIIKAVPEPEHIWKASFHITEVQFV